jgi:5-methylcytosine-specific restriction endonuclease McrA
MKRDEWAQQKAAELLRTQKSILKNWPLQDLTIWLRDGCRCVYCDRDMLHDRDITYCLYNYDHVLPVRKYPALENARWNRVLACRGCNSWKATFDPADSGIPATEELRDKLIERARKYVQEQRVPAEALFAKEQELLRATLGDYEEADAAPA